MATSESFSLKRFEVPLEIQQAFSQVHSNKLVSTEEICNRSDFMREMRKSKWEVQPVIISQSDFVPKTMTEHLMRNKKSSALGSKYVKGDKITNMEGAMHTFLTPVCPITILGDYRYDYGHGIVRLPRGNGRKAILSAAVQPDFECSGSGEVLMRIAEVKQYAITGIPLPDDFQPLWNRCIDDHQKFEGQRNRYEESLQKHMIYFLTKNHRLPAFKEIRANVMTYSEAVGMLKQAIQGDRDRDFIEVVHNKYVQLLKYVLSLEVLLMVYIQQLRNEFSIFEQLLPQGYVYTISPPVIFASEIGGAENVTLLNRLQILAFLHLRQSSSFENLKIIGFSNFCDKGAIPLLQHVFFDKQVVEKETLFLKGHYSVTESYALVLHNNSDAFGQNIETEGPSSLDGVIGTYSDAACHLQRQRKDLVEIMV